jgi:hypothetical protein
MNDGNIVLFIGTNGCSVLEPQMWDLLYHAIDNANTGNHQSLDVCVLVIPCKFLGHLHTYIQGFHVMGKPSEKPEWMNSEHPCLLTKEKALLRDLLTNERSVVLSNYHNTIKVHYNQGVVFSNYHTTIKVRKISKSTFQTTILQSR